MLPLDRQLLVSPEIAHLRCEATTQSSHNCGLPFPLRIPDPSKSPRYSKSEFQLRNNTDYVDSREGLCQTIHSKLKTLSIDQHQLSASGHSRTSD